jgi:hypothetical protein
VEKTTSGIGPRNIGHSGKHEHQHAMRSAPRRDFQAAPLEPATS